MLDTNLPAKAKSFWRKPEGTTGMIVLALAAVAAALGLNALGLGTLMKGLVALLQNTLHAVLPGAE